MTHGYGFKRLPAILLMLMAAGEVATAESVTRRAVRIPNPRYDEPQSKPNRYYCGPPLGEVQVVAEGVDNGAAQIAPTNYPAERHVVYAPADDTYMVFYEWAAAGDFAINANYWQTIGGIGFWSFPGIVSDPEQETDAGRPSAHETEDGVMAAYHATDGDTYNIWVNRFDFASGAWGTSVPVSSGETQTVFPFLDRSSDGTWFIVAVQGEGIVDIVVETSTDGVNWNESVAATGVKDVWVLPSGAADPDNGDIYICYNSDADQDGDGDAVVQRSTDGGVTWSPPRVVAEGAPGSQKVVPSMVVDRDHGVHVIFQDNISDTYETGLVGFAESGPVGVPEYVSGVFSGDEWVENARFPLMDRARLAALPDSCGFEPTPENVATDTLAGLPQIGIERQAGDDILVAVYPAVYMAVGAEGGGWDVCGPAFQIWEQSLRVGGAAEWSARGQVSAISQEDANAGRNAIFSHVTHEISPTCGTGFAWSEMYGASAPADVMFVRLIIDDIAGQGRGGTGNGGLPGAPSRARLLQNAPNPFNPSTRITFELAQAGPAELTIYDAAGRRVRTLLRESRVSAGTHALHWDGRSDSGDPAASGIYFYRLQTAEGVLTRSMAMIK